MSNKPIRDYRKEAGLMPPPPPCKEQWIASRFEITEAGLNYFTKWRTTHVKCACCGREKAL